MNYSDLEGLKKVYAFIPPIQKVIKCKIEAFRNISFKDNKEIDIGDCFKLTGFTNGFEISFYIYPDTDFDIYKLSLKSFSTEP